MWPSPDERNNRRALGCGPPLMSVIIDVPWGVALLRGGTQTLDNTRALRPALAPRHVYYQVSVKALLSRSAVFLPPPPAYESVHRQLADTLPPYLHAGGVGE